MRDDRANKEGIPSPLPSLEPPRGLSSASTSSDPTEIVRSFIAYLEVQQEGIKTEREQAIRRSARESLRYRYALPKLTSGVIAAVFAVLVAFLNEGKGPFLYEVIRAPIANAIANRELQDLYRQAGELRDELAKQGSVPIRDVDFPSGDDVTLADLKSVGFRYDKQRGYDPLSFTGVRDDFNRLSGIANHRANILSKQNSRSPEEQDILNSARIGAKRIEDQISNIINRIPTLETDIRRRATRYLTLGLGLVTAVVGLLFLCIWSREKSDERWMAFLLTEAGFDEIFLRLKQRYSGRPISRLELDALVADKQLPNRSSLLFGASVEMSLIQPISTLLIEKLRNRGCLRELRPTGAGPSYELC